MTSPREIYLLEAYAAANDGRSPSADELRAEIGAHGGLRIIGLVAVPVDEAVLCLVVADSDESVLEIEALADRYGPAARLLRVRWAAE